MGEPEFVSVPIGLMQAIVNYVQFGSFPNGVTVQEIIALNEAMMAAVRDSGVAIVQRPADERPDDVIPAEVDGNA